MEALGSPMPDFSLMNIDGKTFSNDDFVSSKVIVIVFMCNHCPYVQKMWGDLVSLSKNLIGIQFIGINSNANPDYPEDSYEKMKEYAHERGMFFPYLYDETQEVAHAFNAQCTPDIFVYGEDRKLAYRGAFDGVKDACLALLDGKPPSKNQLHSMGCSIKWNR